MDKRLVGDLIKARKAVRRKYDTLKADIAESQTALAEQFKPISQPLTELLTTIKEEEGGIKPLSIKRRVSTPVSLPRPRQVSTPTRAPIPGPSTPALVTSTPGVAREEVFYESQPEEEYVDDEQEDAELEASVAAAKESIRQMLDPAVLGGYLDSFEGLAKTYIEGLVRDTEGNYDLKYGVRWDIDTDEYSIGNKSLEFDGENMVITDHGNRIVYKGTPGFYELMFKKKPTGYTKADEENYRDIVNRSAANRVNYDPKQQISGNVGTKYKKIVGPLTTPSSRIKPPGRPASKLPRTGRGLLTVTNKNVEFVPWKDPNSLVDRLRILLASQVAGHTGHSNEIANITQALRDAKIIY